MGLATLADGRVLITGGVGLDEQGYGTYLADAELFDPQTNTFAPTGPMTHGRDGNATITPLLDGRVLVTGGIGQDAQGSNVALASAEVYDPATCTFAATAKDMYSVRSFRAASRLADCASDVAVGAGERLASAISMTVTNLFRPPTHGQPRNTRPRPRAGRRGWGRRTTSTRTLCIGRLYDPATVQFTQTAAHRSASCDCVIAGDGRVLVGVGLDNGSWRPYGEIYDPARHVPRAARPVAPRPRETTCQTAAHCSLPETDEGENEGRERYDPLTALHDGQTALAGRVATAFCTTAGAVAVGSGRGTPLAYAETYVPNTGPYTDLVAELHASSDEVPPGKSFQYTLTVANRGTQIARDVALDVELPEQAAVTGYRIYRPRLDPPWRCSHAGSQLSCAPVTGRLRAMPTATVPAVTIRIDAVAPATIPDMPLVATTIASTSTNEDITANNEASALVFVAEPARTPARGTMRAACGQRLGSCAAGRRQRAYT